MTTKPDPFAPPRVDPAELAKARCEAGVLAIPVMNWTVLDDDGNPIAWGKSGDAIVGDDDKAERTARGRTSERN